MTVLGAASSRTMTALAAAFSRTTMAAGVTVIDQPKATRQYETLCYVQGISPTRASFRCLEAVISRLQEASHVLKCILELRATATCPA